MKSAQARLFSIFLLFPVFTATARAQQKITPATAPRTVSKLDLQEGDTLVFLGDSITHQCLYTQYIEDFFYTRFPDRHIHFHNAGVSGDQTTDALTRFEDDTAKFKAKYVAILLGMNDGHYQDFSLETFHTYTAGMEEIIAQIRKSGAIPIALSPTMFDHHQLALQLKNNPKFRFRNLPFSSQYNSLMAFYGAWLRETAGADHIPFINLWGPLNDFTSTGRRTNPDFSLVEDSIHPGGAGHVIMACSILSQLPPTRRTVSNISITHSGKNWKSSKGVTNLKVSENADKVSFTFLASSLPWVVPPGLSDYEISRGETTPASLGYKLTAAGHRLSNERLRIAGLAPGAYQLTIDGKPVGKFNHLALGSKVELQANSNTPQYQQAMSVAVLNRERNDKAVRPMRDTWARIKGLRRKNDEVLFQKTYPELLQRIKELQEAAAVYEGRIYQAAHPQARTYQLNRVQPTGKQG